MFCISILAYSKIEKEYKDFWITNFILGVIALFMCTNFFPWKYMPQILTNVQYPWRMLGFSIFFFSAVFAMNIYYLINSIKKEKLKSVIYILVLIIIGIFTIQKLTMYHDEENNDAQYEEKIRNNPIISHFSVCRDYLPVKAFNQQSGYMNTREDRVYVLIGDVTIENEEKHALDLKFDVYKEEDASVTLELPYIYYPGYTITLIKENNEKVKLNGYESSNGFISIDIPEGVSICKIEAKYTGTYAEKIMYILSGISLIIFVVYIIELKKTNNK